MINRNLETVQDRR